MINLEQVKLLESKIDKTIDYIGKLTGENAALKGKLDTYQKRITELEVLIKRFKNDQSRIEDTILSALDRLNKFEDAVEAALPKETPLPKTNDAKPEPEASPDSEKNQGERELDIY